jgi:hypothetical protein
MKRVKKGFWGCSSRFVAVLVPLVPHMTLPKKIPLPRPLLPGESAEEKRLRRSAEQVAEIGDHACLVIETSVKG